MALKQIKQLPSVKSETELADRWIDLGPNRFKCSYGSHVKSVCANMQKRSQEAESIIQL